MSQLDADQTRRIAALAKLEIPDDTISEMAAQLSSILNHIDQLEDVETDRVEPLTHPHDLHNIVGDDIIVPPIDRDLILGNAPNQDGEYYRVPAVIQNRTQED